MGDHCIYDRGRLMANAHLVGGQNCGIRGQESSRYVAAFAEIKMQIHLWLLLGFGLDQAPFA